MRRRIQMTCNKSVSLPGRHRGTPLHKPFNLVSLNCLVFLNHFYFKYVPNRKEKSRMTSWLLSLLGSIDFLCAHWNNIWQLEKKEANWTEEGTNVAKDRKLNIIQSYCPVSGNKCVKTTKFITVSSLQKPCYEMHENCHSSEFIQLVTVSWNKAEHMKICFVESSPSLFFLTSSQ